MPEAGRAPFAAPGATPGATPGTTSARALPGLWPGLAAFLAAAALFTLWLRAERARDRDAALAAAAQAAGAAAAAAAAAPGRLAEVLPDELPAAMDTLDVTADQLARFREADACARRLASVVVAALPGQPPGRVRFRSGNYVSPVFAVSAAPVRVALPFPGPYAAGAGILGVLGATTGVAVALTPPWQVPSAAGPQLRPVTWTPLPPCADARP